MGDEREKRRGLSRRMGFSGWMEKVRNRDQWRRNVEEAKAHPGL